MIKNILVAIGSEPYKKNALEYAGHLAVLLGAHHLSCVHFQEHRDNGKGVLLVDGVLRDVDEEYAQYGFLDYHVETLIGKPSEKIREKARAADLVVLGIPESIKTNGLKLVYDQIDDILLKITKPTIVVHEQCTLVRKILTVYHGDAYSDRVLELATEFAERTEASLLGLAIADTEHDSQRNAQAMQEYLKYHEVETELTTRLGFTVANVLEVASEQDCDLIALSASHHGRLYEMIFNSTTETVVKLANRAVMVVR